MLIFSRFTMRYPPEEWEIECEDRFASAVAAESAAPLSAQLLVQVDKAARISGCYQVLFGGTCNVKVDVPADKILSMGGAAAFR